MELMNSNNFCFEIRHQINPIKKENLRLGRVDTNQGGEFVGISNNITKL